MFPNVRRLRIELERSRRYNYEDNDGQPGIKWETVDPNSKPSVDPFLAHHFFGLEKLEIYSIPIPEVNLDSLFTGLTTEDVEELRKRPPFPIPPDCLAITTRRSGSLVLFKGLKELAMSFTMPNNTRRKDLVGNPVMTQVAVDYGLKLVPHINITFLYDFRCIRANLIRKTLEPASQFGHRDVNEPF